MGLSRGQAGVEYLSNYSIAAVVVIIVLAAFTYFGVWDMILGGQQVPICIFQKGIDCDTHYIKQGDDVVTLNLYNRFEDAIIISGVLCSAEAIDPATALPYSKSWNMPNIPGQRPSINGIELQTPLQPVPDRPLVLANHPFELKAYCYTEQGGGVGSMGPQERYAGIVFIQYRLNSSPDLFKHMIQGNLQGRPN